MPRSLRSVGYYNGIKYKYFIKNGINNSLKCSGNDDNRSTIVLRIIVLVCVQCVELWLLYFKFEREVES